MQAIVGTENDVNYDPNLTMCGRMAVQEVRLKLQMWHYTAEMTVEVGGNCKGFDVMEAAVENAYEKLRGDAEWATVTLTAENGDTLECEDEEDREEDWLKRMTVGVEIISITPEGKVSANAQVHRKNCP